MTDPIGLKEVISRAFSALRELMCTYLKSGIQDVVVNEGFKPSYFNVPAAAEARIHQTPQHKDIK